MNKEELAAVQAILQVLQFLVTALSQSSTTMMFMPQIQAAVTGARERLDALAVPAELTKDEVTAKDASSRKSAKE